MYMILNIQISEDFGKAKYVVKSSWFLISHHSIFCHLPLNKWQYIPSMEHASFLNHFYKDFQKYGLLLSRMISLNSKRKKNTQQSKHPNHSLLSAIPENQGLLHRCISTFNEAIEIPSLRAQKHAKTVFEK